ncbi:VOC family protein [Saccharothrix australiensis]|nr:VOC family protein [Saccharothrix australiensis]
MSATLSGLVLGTPSPPVLADFYRALLGWSEVSRAPEWARIRPEDSAGPGLSFQLERDFVPPAWPSRPGGQQLQAHLDIRVDDLQAETARAVALGATVEEHQPQPDGVRVLRDPHGNLFCLFLPGY